MLASRRDWLILFKGIFGPFSLKIVSIMTPRRLMGEL